MRYVKLILFVLAVCSASNGYADTSAVFPVSASIRDQLELTGWVKELAAGETDPGTEGAEKSFPCTMAFGDSSGYLTSELSGGSDAGGLYSPTWYAVFMVAKTSGRAYKIESQATSFAGVSGTAIGHSLDKSFILTPEYQLEDEWQWEGGSGPQGPDPNPSASVGPQTLAVGTHEIYNSGAGGASRIVRAFYSLPPYPETGHTRPSGWEIIDANKPEGIYEGAVVISLTLTGS